MKDNGIIIEKHNPQPEVRKNAEAARDWEFQEEAAYLYRMAVLMRDRLIDPVLLTTRDRVSDPVISFDNLRNFNVLACYTLRRNPQGLLYEITMNTEHYRKNEAGKMEWEFGRWAQAETLLHEQVHLWQQNAGKEPFKAGKSKSTHNREFCLKMESLGLHPMPGVGCHVAVADPDKPFGILMKELGIERPGDVPHSSGKFDWFEGPTKRKGSSSLTKWSCGCQNARIGAKEFHAVCTVCGNPFIPVETQATAVLGMVEPEKEGGVIRSAPDIPKKAEPELTGDLPAPDSPIDIDTLIKEKHEQDLQSNDASEDLSTYMDQYSQP